MTTESFDCTRAMAFPDGTFVHYPDWEAVAVELLAEDDKVVVSFREAGTSAMQGGQGKTVGTDGIVLLTICQWQDRHDPRFLRQLT